MAVDEAQAGAPDEAFLQTLYQGSDLLGKGELAPAREALESALRMRPGDAKAKNLLGLACFKLGEHERALKLYDELVDDNPTDATLRVNLGLVYLKSGRFEEAIRELSAATDLQPEHKRAHNYLGLAYARVGDYAQARECFAAAGSDQMVEKMERALAGEPFDGEEALAAPPPPPDGAASRLGDDTDEDEAVLVEVDLSDIPEPTAEAASPEAAPAPARPTPVVAAVAPPAAAGWGAASSLPSIAKAAVVEPDVGPFAVGAEIVVARVDGQILSRVNGLVAAEGNLAFAPEVKRFRGRATDKPFGDGEDRVLRVTGDGRLLVARCGHAFTAVDIDGGDGYFQESVVFAFEEEVVYENGRVPSSVSPDLNLVHLRGNGSVLLRTSGPLVAVPLESGQALKVPMPRLVGWHGSITPRLASFADEGGEDGGPLVGVELTGEGQVFLAMPGEG